MGNLFKGDSQSSATLVSSDKSVILVNNAAKAYEGIYNFSNVIIKVTPGSTVNLTLEVDGLSIYSENNYIQYIEIPFQIQIQTRKCIAGESYTIDNRCIQCASGYYIF